MATSEKQANLVLEAIALELKPAWEAEGLCVTKTVNKDHNRYYITTAHKISGKSLTIHRFSSGGKFVLCNASLPHVEISLARPDSLKIVKRIYIYCARRHDYTNNYTCGKCPVAEYK